MSKLKGRHPSPALVISLIALFVALGGSAYALKKNSVGTKQLKAKAVTNAKLAPSVRGRAIAFATIGSSGDVIESKSRGIGDGNVGKPGGAGGTAFCLHGLPTSKTAVVTPVYDSSIEFEGFPVTAIAKAPLPDVDCDTVSGTQYEVITRQGAVTAATDAFDAAPFVITLLQ